MEAPKLTWDEFKVFCLKYVFILTSFFAILIFKTTLIYLCSIYNFILIYFCEFSIISSPVRSFFKLCFHIIVWKHFSSFLFMIEMILATPIACNRPDRSLLYRDDRSTTTIYGNTLLLQ